MAVTTKTGLAPGVSPLKLRPYVGGALASSQTVPSRGATTASSTQGGEGGLGSAEGGPPGGGAVVEELSSEAVARLKTAITEVR